MAEYKMLHYLYFPNEAIAKKALKKIVHMKGLEYESRMGADRTNWLILVKHKWPITRVEFNDIEKMLKRITNTYLGEYDGWEIPLN